MEKDFLIYNELAAAAVKVFNEGIDAPAGTYTLAELAKVGTTCKTAPTHSTLHPPYHLTASRQQRATTTPTRSTLPRRPCYKSLCYRLRKKSRNP